MIEHAQTVVFSQATGHRSQEIHCHSALPIRSIIHLSLEKSRKGKVKFLILINLILQKLRNWVFCKK